MWSLSSSRCSISAVPTCLARANKPSARRFESASRLLPHPCINVSRPAAGGELVARLRAAPQNTRTLNLSAHQSQPRSVTLEVDEQSIACAAAAWFARTQAGHAVLSSPAGFPVHGAFRQDGLPARRSARRLAGRDLSSRSVAAPQRNGCVGDIAFPVDRRNGCSVSE